jgi:hypothetical protein
MMSEKILTLHPENNKEGVNIDRIKYEAVKSAILDAIDRHGEISFQNLMQTVESQLPDFDGSIPWYVTSVKLDLEARGLIERIPKSSPQRIRRS